MAVNATPDDDWSWVDQDSTEWVPPPVDTSLASVARMYDYLIGGKDNFAVDRDAADQLLQVVPTAAEAAQANRAFLIKTVQDMADAGIDQFLDLGTGIPTSPNVHETARTVHPDAAVVYVDNDPIVMAHNRATLATDPRVVTLPHDLRDPATVLEDAQLRRVLDLDRPVGLLMIAVMHFVDLTSAPLIMSRYIADLPRGSRLALTAVCRDGVDADSLARTERVYEKASAPMVMRTRTQIEQLFDGVDLQPPGLVDLHFSGHGRIMGGTAVK